jgi:C4-dicarboxylate transporter/malic acid transport protein
MKPFLHHNYNLVNVIKNFTPNWFAMNMGLGITAICTNIIFAKLQINNYLSVILWLFNIFVLNIFIILFILKIIIFPKSFINMLKHSSQPMFLGCIPMALATIINGIIIFGTKIWGENITHIALNLWYIDTALALFCIIVIPCFMFISHDHKLQNMTGLWLLPFVACEVASASGNILLPYIDNISIQNIIFIINIILWTISVILAFHILVILFYRLTIHKIPSHELSATIWLPVGPMATGSFTMFLFANIIKSMPHLDTHIFELFQFANWCNIIGVILWVIASWWVIIAIIISGYYIYNRLLTFNLGFWGYTFPLGVYILSTNQFFIKSNFIAFGVITYVSIIILLLICLYLLFKTVKGFYNGSLIIDTNIINNKN